VVCRFEALQRRVEGTVIDQEFISGLLLDRAGNPLSMPRAEQEHPEDQDVEGSLEEGDASPLLG
jgi:hypothetical protein